MTGNMQHSIRDASNLITSFCLLICIIHLFLTESLYYAALIVDGGFWFATESGPYVHFYVYMTAV